MGIEYGLVAFMFAVASLCGALALSEFRLRQSLERQLAASDRFFAVHVEDLESRIQSERTRAERAEGRLLAAWRDGFTVPQDVPDDNDVALSELPASILEWLSQWEDPEAVTRWSLFFHQRLAQGRSVDAAIMDAEQKMGQLVVEVPG